MTVRNLHHPGVLQARRVYCVMRARGESHPLPADLPVRTQLTGLRFRARAVREEGALLSQVLLPHALHLAPS